MHRDKIQAALTKALTHIEEAINTMKASGSTEKALGDSLWAASAETEYALFLLALMQGDRAESAFMKRTSATRQIVELDIALAFARELFNSAKARVDENSFGASYEAASSARNLLLKAQEQLRKKRKEAER